MKQQYRKEAVRPHRWMSQISMLYCVPNANA